MKIRTGFVSNSSSSSFVFLVKKEAHEKAYAQLTEYEKSVIDEIAFNDTIFGTEIIGIGDMSNNGGYSYTFEDIESNDDDDENDSKCGYDAYDKYAGLIPKEDRWEWSMGG